MSVDDFIRAQDRMLSRYGVEAESRFVEVPLLTGRAHALVTGEGPPVLMVIGGGMAAGMWAPLLAQLEGFTLYAVDLPGCGLSDPTAYRTDTIRSTAATFLEQVLDGLGLDSPVFVAQSMGGLWSTWLAFEQPDRVPAIAYIGCPALLLGTSAPFLLRLSSIPPLGRLLMRLQPPSLEQVDRFAAMAGESLADLPELRELFLAHAKLPASGPQLMALLHACVRIRGARPEVRLTAEQLAHLPQPVQLIWGENDTFGPPSVGRRAAEIIPDAELHVVGGGHGPWFTQAEVIGPILAPFLHAHSTVGLRT